jgi:Arc/MetJ-type ribon-helix-helix transcriptional regulator
MARSITAADLPPDLARFAEAQVAARRFASVEDVVKAGLTLLQQRREGHPATNDAALEEPAPVNPARAPFWATFTEQVHALPDEVFERLPRDGASGHEQRRQKRHDAIDAALEGGARSGLFEGNPFASVRAELGRREGV